MMMITKKYNLKTTSKNLWLRENGNLCYSDIILGIRVRGAPCSKAVHKDTGITKDDIPNVRLQNELYCVVWAIKLYSLTSDQMIKIFNYYHINSQQDYTFAIQTVKKNTK